MSTAIEWTHRPGTKGEVWNPVTGCTKVSAGCKFCYAERVADRFWPTQYPPVVVALGEEGDLTRERRFTDVECHEDRLALPLRWQKPRTVFVNSMSDLFHEAVSDEFISRVFAVMALCPQHTFIILTKRSGRMRAYVEEMTTDPDAYCFAWAREMEDAPTLKDETWPLPNVWLGVSVEDQPSACARIPYLTDTPAAVRFVSAEPLLGPIVFDDSDGPGVGGFFNWFKQGISWLIVGGESGSQARPCDVEWIRSLVQQAHEAFVPVFVKQDSGPKPGKQGVIPTDLWIKEWPA